MGALETLYNELAAIHTPDFLLAMVKHLDDEFSGLKARLDALDGGPTRDVSALDSAESPDENSTS